MARLALLTSGGDAPGMNSAIRAVVRAAISNGIEVVGIRHGFEGLANEELAPMTRDSVANIIHQGGTILRTSRWPEFRQPENQARAAAVLEKHKIDYLVPIGGDGTLRGSANLAKAIAARMAHIPSTIDNDVYGTDFTIGFDTAVSTAVDAIDRIRDTVFSLERLFFVEVMGRQAGFIALEAGIAGGAHEVLVPEVPMSLSELSQSIMDSFKRGKTGCIVVVAEGDIPGGAFEVAREVKALTGIDSRVCILGHTQRGGPPTARDRVLATKLGVAAVEALLRGDNGILVGEGRGQITYTPLSEALTKRKSLDSSLVHLLKVAAG